MTLTELLALLRELNIHLYVKDGKLKYQAPHNVLTDEIKHKIKTNKKALIELLTNTGNRNRPVILPTLRSKASPLSYAQQRLWFLDQLEPGSAFYNMPMALRLTGQINTLALEQSINEIVRRHENLRTRFVTANGQGEQVIVDSLRIPVPCMDLSGLPEPTRQGVALQVCHQEAITPFVLATGPLIRVRFICLSDENDRQEAILLVTLHHIISDGWSNGVLTREFVTLYQTFNEGLASPLNELAIQYADFAYWQRQWLDGAVLQRQIDYWQQKLSGVPALLELPTDHPRPSVMRYQGNSYSFTVPLALSEQIQALSRQHQVTLFVTMLTSFSVMLSRYSQQTDLCIGTPIANRNRLEIEELIGFFVNTLVLRADLSGEPSFSELLAQLNSTVQEAQNHQDLPFEQLVTLLQPERSLSYSPLFQVLFTLDRTTTQSAATLPGLTIGGVEDEGTTAKFDLSLHVSQPTNGLLQCVFEYNTDLFDASTIARMAQHYLNLLQGIVEYPQQPVALLPLLTVAETRQLLIDFNATEAEFPQHLCIHQLFEQQVEQSPDAIALVYEDQSLSYDQLNRQANRLAHHLITLGIRPDDRVAICVERSLEMVVGLLGILKAGGAYVPLDPSYPEERLAYMLADCAPVALLTQQALRAVSALSDESLHVPVILLDMLDAQADAVNLEHNPDPLALGLTSQHLAYVIYTSGSTGQPKGVMNQHQGVVNRLWWAQNEYRLDCHDRILQKTPFSFDVSVWEFFLPLLAGAQLVIAKPKGHQDPHYLAALMTETCITTVHFVPSMLQVFLDQADAQPCTSLRRVLCSGEALPYALQMRFHTLLPNVELHNLYGPTEAAIDVTSWLCRPEHLLGIVPIGHPIANTQMYILDAHLQPVPLGVTGELYIGGAGVARGYLGRPELTAERFIDNPFPQIWHNPNGEGAEAADSQFAGASSPRLYKTGDLGRWLPDGSIEYLGRNDFQVKIRGFRIELGEIEAQLSHCAGVREAVVVAREDVPGDKRLVAYLLADAGQALSAADLRSQLASSLADYMLPSAFVTLDAFPLTPNGKLDRKALPAPDGSAVITRTYEAPQGETETLIAEIWKELLHLDQVGRYDQFFELGGHSLLVVTLIERMRQQGLTATVRTVFTAPVLADMAALLDGQHSAAIMVPPNLIPDHCTAITPELLPLVSLSQAEIDGLIEAVPGGVGNIQDIYPLAPLQEGILFHHLLETQGDAYLLRSVLSFDNRSRLDGFLAALQAVIDRHDILRTAIHWQGLPQPVQVVQRQASLPIIELELAGDTSDTVYNLLLKQTDPRQLRLNLQQAPLFTAYIAFDPQADEWLLSLLNHHLVCEHVTLELIIAEIQQILAGQLASLPAPLPYRNFIAQALSVSPAEHEAYFRERLSDIDAPTAPFDILDVQGDGSRICEATVPLSADLAQRIRSSAKQHGITTAVLFHLAWAQVLAQCTGRDDVVFGTVLMGRLQGSNDADRVLGLFINTLPIRISLGERSVRQLVDETYRNLSGLLNHEQASLAFAQRCSAVEAPMPLFTTLLNYRHSGTQSNPTPDNDAALADQSAWKGIKAHHGEERTNYPITLSVDDFGQDFSLTAQCVNGINPERIAAYLETAVSQLIDALGQQPELPINRLSILPPYEWQQVINGFNATETYFPQELYIHQLFEQQVEQSPDAIALVYEDQSLSYDQLNRQANRLAHHLITLGIRPDDRVAICVERSLEMVVGLLGILKAGGAYVPLDPSYPEERLAYMLADCAPVALLTQQALRAVSALSDESLHVPVILLDMLDAQADAVNLEHNPDPLALGLTSQHLAYVIYTSGSTGQPKGVMVSHANVGRLFTATDAQFNFNHDDVWTLFHSFAFDFSVWELWGALLYGGRLVVVPYATSRNPDDFYRLLCQERVTVLNQTPSAFKQLIAAQAQNPLEHSLRTIVFGGEALDFHSLIPWLEHNDPERTQLINMYGITEITVHATYRRLTQQDVEAGQGSNVGTGLADLQIYLLDQHLQPVPLGVTGELYIGGAGVARGYLGRPELTAERFIDNPFLQTRHNLNGEGIEAADHQLAGASSPRLYKTGDLGRWLPDGSIEYLGRNDFQVKIRGFRIELGEIEAQLSRCTGVREAVVIAREDVPGDKRLVAYLLADAGQALSATDLRSQLSASLADYMLPSAFVILDAFPLTSNGKLDRKALPAPDGNNMGLVEIYTAPRTQEEEVLAAIWSQILGVETVGIDDGFFELGGDSIRTIQVLNLAKQRGIEFSLALLYQHQTIRALLEAIAVQHPSATRLMSIKPFALISNTDYQKLPFGIEDAFPLTALQAGMIYHSEIDRYAYHVVDTITLKCLLDKEILTQTIKQIFANHPVLRTAFDMGSYSEPLQLVSSNDSLTVEVGFDDWSKLTEQQQKYQLKIWLELEKNKVFDITKAPLIRFHIHQFADDIFHLAVTEHHAILDGWSVMSLLTELCTSYLAALNHRPSVLLPPPANTLRDLVVWERDVMNSEQSLNFWQKQLEIVTHSILPTYKKSNDFADYQHTPSIKIHKMLPQQLSKGLQTLAKSLSVPLKTVLLTAHLKVLSILYGEQMVTTGLVCSIRPEVADADRSLGVFLNTLPFTTELSNKTWRDLIIQVFAAEQDLLKHRFYPLAEIQRLHKKPLFDSMFHYLHYHVASELAKSDELQILHWDDDIQALATLLAAFQQDILGSQISITIYGDSNQLITAQVESIANYYLNILTNITEDPLCYPSRHSFLTETEQKKILIDFNITKTDFPQHLCIHQLFEQQVEQSPDAIALVYEDQSLSYDQLNRQANRLAHHLITLGIRPDDRVAICVERSLEMVVGLLGILKAGGAYVPLDPSYPEERLAYMLADCAPVALLTQQALRAVSALSDESLHVPVILLDMLDAQADAVNLEHNPDPLALGLTSQHLAYVIYTSGSTGQPKGVMNQHQGVVNRLWWAQNEYRLDCHDRILQKTPFSFDVSVWEFFLPLLAGAQLVIAKPKGHQDPHYLAALMTETCITTVHFVPSMLQVFLDQADAQPCTSLRRVLCSGEALPYALQMRFHTLLPNVELHNLYGPTEAAIDVTSWLCRPEHLLGIVPIGHPIANTQMYILDAHLQPVPLGVTGELYIGGAGVARGYLGRPELTAERFIDNPFPQIWHNPNGEGAEAADSQFAGASSPRLYKTGDLGRWLPDGSIEYLGRNDFQVKIRGFRIELGEIEAQLSHCAGVREAVVVAREDVPGDKRLVAYLLADAGQALSAADLRSQLASSLADYMLPSAFVTLDAFPLTPNGKLNRKALPIPDISEQLKQQFIAPRTSIEAAMAHIWSELLNIEPVGIKDNFLDLGGHSLLATQLITRINIKFDIKLPLKILFEANTIEKLSEKVNLTLWIKNKENNNPLLKDNIEYEDIEL